MTVKTSISLTDQQSAFARKLVKQGRYSSVSAVVQQGLEMLQSQTEATEAETALLRQLLQERAEGPFVEMDDEDDVFERVIAEKRAEYGLSD